MIIVALLQLILNCPFIVALQRAEYAPIHMVSRRVGLLGFDINPVYVKCMEEFEDLRGHKY
jgi:hypothetical protein